MKVSLYRIRLNNGGYTSQGYYYGHGAPLYGFTLPNGEEGTCRAATRELAKAHVRQVIPGATFSN